MKTQNHKSHIFPEPFGTLLLKTYWRRSLPNDARAPISLFVDRKTKRGEKLQ